MRTRARHLRGTSQAKSNLIFYPLSMSTDTKVKDPEMELYTEKDAEGRVVFATMRPKGASKKPLTPNQD